MGHNFGAQKPFLTPHPDFPKDWTGPTMLPFVQPCNVGLVPLKCKNPQKGPGSMSWAFTFQGESLSSPFLRGSEETEKVGAEPPKGE